MRHRHWLIWAALSIGLTGRQPAARPCAMDHPKKLR
jgi:hypothetical protein